MAASGMGVFLQHRLVVAIVGVAETVWLFEGSGLKLLQHTLQRVFGAG